MTKEEFSRIENYMLSCMADSAHDREHVYRVLYLALDIAETEPAADLDVLIAACLLHDVGRQKQLADPLVDHAEAGADMAAAFLSEMGYGPGFCDHTAACIRSHRFRKSHPPESFEAQILFDADKLDVCGAIGVARTLLYGGRSGSPLYVRGEDGAISDGSEDREDKAAGSAASFFHEYHYKLEKLYDRFYTERGKALAEARRSAAVRFYESLLSEVREAEETGRRRLRSLL